MIANLSRLFPNFHTEALSQSRKVQKQLTQKLIYGIGNEELDKQIFQHVAQFIKETKRFSYWLRFHF